MVDYEKNLPLLTRLWFAWVCFFRVLFDENFAMRAWKARELSAPLPSPELAPPPKAEPAKVAVTSALAENTAEPKSTGPALQLLALLQREGRLIDFVEQDIASFSDAEVGAVARVIHEGCRKAIHGHVKLSSIRSEEEGTPVTLSAGYNPAEVKLSGNVQGSAPYKGVLRHRGWRATDLSLPTPVKGHDSSVIASAEVEL